MHGKDLARSEKRITLVISNEDTDDTTRIIKLLENSRILVDGVIETVKHEIKKGRSIYWYVTWNIKQFSVNCYVMLTEKGVMIAEKGIVRAGREWNNIDHMDKSF